VRACSSCTRLPATLPARCPSGGLGQQALPLLRRTRSGSGPPTSRRRGPWRTPCQTAPHEAIGGGHPATAGRLRIVTDVLLLADRARSTARSRAYRAPRVAAPDHGPRALRVARRSDKKARPGVASNVATRDRRVATGRRGTAPDASVRVGRLMSCAGGSAPRGGTVGYDRTWVASAGRRWTAETVRRVHGMEEDIRGSIVLTSTQRPQVIRGLLRDRATLDVTLNVASRRRLATLKLGLRHCRESC
jgi:hypothetical protein